MVEKKGDGADRPFTEKRSVPPLVQYVDECP